MCFKGLKIIVSKSYGTYSTLTYVILHKYNFCSFGKLAIVKIKYLLTDTALYFEKIIKK